MMSCSCICMLNPFFFFFFRSKFVARAQSQKTHSTKNLIRSRTRCSYHTGSSNFDIVAAIASHWAIGGRKRACIWIKHVSLQARPSSEHELSVIVVAVGRGCCLYREGPGGGRGEGKDTMGRIVGARPSVGTVRRAWFPSKHTTCKRQLPDTRPHQAIVTVPCILVAPSRAAKSMLPTLG